MYQRLTQLASPLVAAPRPWRRSIAMALDAVGIAGALAAALALRFDGIPIELADLAMITVIAWLAAAFVFWAGRLYQSLIRAMALTGYLVIGGGLATAAVAIAVLESVPWDVAISFATLGTLSLTALRVTIRALILRGPARSARPVIIYGAGGSGRQMATALSGGVAYRPVAFVDDADALVGATMNGLPVRAPAELPALIERLNAKMIILAMPSVSKARRSQILRALAPLRVAIRTLPDLNDLVGGRVSAQDLQQVDISDILGRDAVEARAELLAACVREKAVMVTGAGGSIGSELCRQILAQGPKRLVLFEISEISLYQIEQSLRAEMSAMATSVELIALLGDVRDSERLEAAMRRYQIRTVYHAAAYKHVPMVEANVVPGVQNNIFGTWSSALAATRAGVEVFVLISTDKAVNPTNVMGATKRAAELILQGLQTRYPNTMFSMVRFGNVLGSSGSVVPLFAEQIRQGGPVTVTHPDVVRYFMTVREAAQLVIQAGAMARGGDLFVLDMGAPVRIADLARRMIELAGFVVREPGAGGDGITIEYSGLRPGEKLYEELLIGTQVSGTDHPMIMRATEHAWSWEELEPQLERMRRRVEALDASGLIECLGECVREYTPAPEVHDWLEIAPPARLASVARLPRSTKNERAI